MLSHISWQLFLSKHCYVSCGWYFIWLQSCGSEKKIHLVTLSTLLINLHVNIKKKEITGKRALRPKIRKQQKLSCPKGNAKESTYYKNASNSITKWPYKSNRKNKRSSTTIFNRDLTSKQNLLLNKIFLGLKTLIDNPKLLISFTLPQILNVNLFRPDVCIRMLPHDAPKDNAISNTTLKMP